MSFGESRMPFWPKNTEAEHTLLSVFCDEFCYFDVNTQNTYTVTYTVLMYSINVVYDEMY